MVKIQIRLPDILYSEAERIASEREISFAEAVRRGVEYITRIYPPLETGDKNWQLPKPSHLGAFNAPPKDWRTLAND